MIERLCIQADLPKPRIYIVNSTMPNAFALGRSKKAAAVCATTGILELLSPAELEGVMAHELTHIANRDVMVMTLAAFFASLASMIVQFGFFFGGGDDDDNGPGIFAIILVSLVVYVSRSSSWWYCRATAVRCDRGAAIITGRPSALSSALLKISGTMGLPQTDLRAHAEMNAFYIVPAGARTRSSTSSPRTPDGEAHRPARAGGPAAGRRVSRGAWLLDAPRRARSRGAGARPALRDLDRVRRPRCAAGHRARVAGIVFQPLATGDFRQIVDDMQEGPLGTGSRWARRWSQGRLVRLPLDDRARS
jgi:hypothetical protein